MSTVKNPKLSSFLKKLASGLYPKEGNAKAALKSMTGLSDADRNYAKSATFLHFNPKCPAADLPEVLKVEEPQVFPEANANMDLLTGSLNEMHLQRSFALEALHREAQREGHTPIEVQHLISASIEFDLVALFESFVNRYYKSIDASMVDGARLVRSSKYFRFAAAVFRADHPNQSLVNLITNTLGEQVERRAGDLGQMRQFEEAVAAISLRGPCAGLDELIINHASVDFIFKWLGDGNGKGPVWMDRLHLFAHRLMSMFLSSDTDALMLISFIEKFKPELEVVEEIVRVLLAQRQLGDALLAVKIVQPDFKPALHEIILPIIVKHGDPVSILTYGLVFDGLAKRDTIKDLIADYFEPNRDRTVDKMLNGVNTRDYFEPVPSSTPPAEVEEYRNAVFRELGHPITTPSKVVEQPSTGFSFLEDLMRKGVPMYGIPKTKRD